MHNSKLIVILKAFSKEELIEFEKFVRSPYFNTSKAALKLLVEIKKTYPEFKQKRISTEHLFGKIYKKRMFSKVLIRKLISNLLKLSEDFLAINNFRNNKMEMNIKFLNELNDRSLHRVFNVKIKAAEELVNKYNQRSEHFYLNRYQIHYALCEFESRRNILSSRGIFQEQVHEINSYYLASVLRLYSALAMYKHTLDFEFDFLFMEEIENFFNKNPDKIETDIKFFYYTLLMFKTGSPENEEHYFTAKELFQKIKGMLNTNDIKFSLFLLTNFCSMMQQKDNKKFDSEKFEMLKIDSEVSMLQPVDIDPNHYLNTVLSASGAKQFEWAKKYIEELKDKVKPDMREDIYKYANAVLLYDQKRYMDALDYLSTITPTFWQSQSYIKDLTIKIYYELGLYEEVEYQIDSYMHYVKKARNVPKYMRKRDELFIQYLRKLIKLKNSPDDAEIAILKKQILSLNISNKQWLLSKL